MIGWTAINYFSALFVMFLIAISATAALISLSQKGRIYKNLFAPLAMFGILIPGMFSLMGLIATPMDSYMQREFWEAKIQREANREEVDRLVQEELDRMTVNFDEAVPVYCDHSYRGTRTDAQIRHCTALDINRVIERYVERHTDFTTATK